ncbi:MAG: hypothetical protein HYS23_05825 [Geobacter sp.]|nr:hypothetical protein [Geobacter sp.]
MRPRSFRIFSIVVLILALVLLSGLASTVSAAIAVSGLDACCAHQQSDTQPDVPCPDIDCPCASCISCETIEPFSTTPKSLETVSQHTFLSDLHPDPFTSPIDYPPESV